MCNYTTDPNLLFSVTEFHLTEFHLTELTSLVKAHDSFYRNIYDFLFFWFPIKKSSLKYGLLSFRASRIYYTNTKGLRDRPLLVPIIEIAKNRAIGVRLVNDGFSLF